MMHIRVQDQTLFVESLHFTARIEGGLLVSLVDRETGAEFCRPAASAFPLDLVYMNRESVGAEPGWSLADGPAEGTQPPTRNVTVRSLSPGVARVIYAGNNTDRELFVRLDHETGFDHRVVNALRQLILGERTREGCLRGNLPERLPTASKAGKSQA